MKKMTSPSPSPDSIEDLIILALISAIFLASIYVGADAMSRTIDIPNYIADILVAISLLSVLVGAMLTRYRIEWGK